MSATQESLTSSEGQASEAADTSASEASEQLSFSGALGEIEEILAQIEGDEVDIDTLASSLSRAATLLEVCRSKIRRAESEVEQVSQRLVPDQD